MRCEGYTSFTLPAGCSAIIVFVYVCACCIATRLVVVHTVALCMCVPRLPLRNESRAVFIASRLSAAAAATAVAAGRRRQLSAGRLGFHQCREFNAASRANRVRERTHISSRSFGE